jgi:hypothetical protein
MLNHMRSGLTIQMRLNEASGNFTCTCSPRPTEEQLDLLGADYNIWVKAVSKGWARRRNGHHANVNIAFTNLLRGKISQTTNERSNPSC